MRLYDTSEEKYVLIKIMRKSIPKSRREQKVGTIPKHTTELDMIIINPFFDPPRYATISSEIKNKRDEFYIRQTFEDLGIPKKDFYVLLQKLYYIFSISLSILLTEGKLKENDHSCVTYKYYFERDTFIRTRD